MTLRRLLAHVAVLLVLGAPTAGAQVTACAPGDQEVRSLDFEGNTTFTDSELERRIATSASSFWRRTFSFFGAKHCLDSNSVRLDALRLVVLYNEVGFSKVNVEPEIAPIDSTRVRVRFRITEGIPTRIDSISFNWFPEVPTGASIIRGLPLRDGDRFDRALLEASRDTIERRLRNQGYPTAEALRSFEIDTAQHATVTFDIHPGPRARISRVNVTVNNPAGMSGGTNVNPEQVKRVLGIDEGSLYHERALEQAKRGLYLTDAFRHVDISLDTLSLQDEVDSLVQINVTVAEAELQNGRASLGWGNLDCFRAQGSYANANFLGRLLRLDLSARLSKIGVGYPLDFARALCSDVRQDLFSDTLNYYAGATFSQAALYRLRYVPSVTVFSERRSEFNAFRRDAPIGGLATVFREGDGLWPMTFSYQLEYGRTIAQPAFICRVFQVCEVAAQRQLTQFNRLATLGWATTRTRTNDIASPTHGSILRFEVRHASPVVGSDPRQQFNRLLADGSLYRRIFDGGVLALRLRFGTVRGTEIALQNDTTTSFIPLQERMYAGGPNSVRGYGQNELGSSLWLPATFRRQVLTDSTEYWIATPGDSGQGERPVPLGGDNVIVANLELRVRSAIAPDLIQYALFLDAGEVWNHRRSGTGGFGSIKFTPGVGLRLITPVGPVRVDVGYNPYDFPAGPAYTTPDPRQYASGSSLQLICVSPGNQLVVTTRAPAPGENKPPAPTQAEGTCPASYQPPQRTTFFSRLKLQFSIGQAF